MIKKFFFYAKVSPLCIGAGVVLPDHYYGDSRQPDNKPEVNSFVISTVKCDPVIIQRNNPTSTVHTDSEEEEDNEEELLEDELTKFEENVFNFREHTVNEIRKHPEMRLSLMSFNKEIQKTANFKTATLQKLLATFGKEVGRVARPGRKKNNTIGVSSATKARRTSTAAKRKETDDLQGLPKAKKKKTQPRNLKEAVDSNRGARKTH